MRNSPADLPIRIAQSAWLAFACLVFSGSIASPSTAANENKSPDDSTGRPNKTGNVLLPADAKRPWTKSEGAASTLNNPSKTPRDALINVDDAELQTFFTDDELDPTDSTLIKILYRYPGIGLDFIQQYAEQTKDITWRQVADDPESHRLKIFSFSGRVTGYAQHELSPVDAEILEFTHYYSVQFKIEGTDAPAEIFSRRIPQAWQASTTLNERASCTAMLLKSSATTEEQLPPRMCFATHRVAWHPDREDQKFSIGPSQILLANLGLDVGLFDEVRPLNGRKLDAGDSECFYQMLAAVARANQQELSKAARPELLLAPLIERPAEQHGNLVTVEGDARRITKVSIDKPYFRQRFGIDHYYEIDVLIDLGNQRIKLENNEPGKPAQIITDSYPVVVCVRSLPPGLKVSEDINERVRIPCFFFKHWAYESAYTRAHGVEQGQASPLLIGLEPQHIQFERETNPYIGAIAVALIVLAMGGIWAGLWIYGRGDRNFEREILHKQFEVEKGKSLNDMDIEDDGKMK